MVASGSYFDEPKISKKERREGIQSGTIYQMEPSKEPREPVDSGSNLFCTCDKIGSETGGGIVTANELEALKRLGPVQVINPPMMANPFDADELALKEYKGRYQLAHFYAGTFPKLIAKLQLYGTKLTYTVAAHDIDESRAEFQKLGIPYNFPHMTEPDLLDRYLSSYRAADLVIAPSQHSKEILHRQGIKNVEVIPHGVNLPTEIKPLPERFTVGYLGQPGPDKGLIYLIQAWAKLGYKDAQLVIAGRGTEELLPLIREHGRGSIFLQGFVESTRQFYNSISLYVQPSVTEGFGCEVLEALSYGRVVLCSTGAGACDVVPHEWRFKARDVEALAALIDRCRREPLATYENTCKAIAQEHTWDKIRERYHDIFTTVAGESNRARGREQSVTKAKRRHKTGASG